MQFNYNPINPEQEYGAFSNRFGDTLQSLGWKGSTSLVNPNFSYENPNGQEGTIANPKFLEWLNQNNISMQMGRQGDDYSGQLFQGDQMLGEKNWSSTNAFDRFAEKAIPAAIAIGSGGVLGQALGFLPSGINPLQSSTWGGAGAAPNTGVPFELGNMGATTASAQGPGLTLGGVTQGAAAGSPYSLASATAPALGASGAGAGASSGGLLSSIGGALKTAAPALNAGRVLSSLAQMYASNKAGNRSDSLYRSLAGDFGQDSSYAQALRQELERRDSASGRRSQYGPREVELQAKLAQMKSNNATTLAALMDKTGAADIAKLQGGLGLLDATGLNTAIGQGAEALWDKATESDWWKDLFGG